MKCLKTYNERQRRQFLASKAESMGCHGVNYVCNAVGVCRDTLCRGKHELETDANENFPEGRVRAAGGGRTPTLEKHPEYLDVFDKIASLYTAGLPQDENVIWLTISASQIIGLFKEQGIRVSRYTVKQMKKARGFKERSFVKALTLKDVKDRNAQFEKIQKVRSECESNNIPIFSIDTKKKEMVGNFKRQGTVSCKGQPKAYDQDFKTISDGTIEPHSIYDVGANTGCLTLGTSHDTAELVCDNFVQVWQEHLHIRRNYSGSSLQGNVPHLAARCGSEEIVIKSRNNKNKNKPFFCSNNKIGYYGSRLGNGLFPQGHTSNVRYIAFSMRTYTLLQIYFHVIFK